MDQLVNGVVSVALAIVGVALLAVLVSRNAQTANVIGASGGAFSGGLLAAEAPVLGGGVNLPNLINPQSYGPGY